MKIFRTFLKIPGNDSHCKLSSPAGWPETRRKASDFKERKRWQSAKCAETATINPSP